MNKEIIAKNFKAWRKENKLTMLEIKDTTNVGQSTISQIEKGRNLPSLKALLPLTEKYNLSIDELIGNKQHNKLNEKESELLEKFRLLPEKEQYKLLARIELILEDLEFKSKL